MMNGLEISIEERLVEVGNRFFNLRGKEWPTTNDLHYEESTEDPINRYFIQAEQQWQKTHRGGLFFLLGLWSMFTDLFRKAAKQRKANTKVAKDVKEPQMLNKRVSIYTNNSRQSIDNKVRNRLLSVLNEDLKQINTYQLRNRKQERRNTQTLKNQPRIAESVNATQQNTALVFAAWVFKSIKKGMRKFLLWGLSRIPFRNSSELADRLQLRTKHRVPRR
jgi:hypothetical protein